MKSISFAVVVLLVAVGLSAAEIQNKGWWKNAVFYQVYPRSLKDSDGNGIGDLKGITSKLKHFTSTGITAIWLSPINKSPMNDFGYDISDFRDVDPTFGSLEDLKDLLAEAHKIGLKVILDLVPNHTSNQHLWFEKSANHTDEKRYVDYYIWVNGTKGTPPNKWVSVFNGSAWTYHEGRKQFYFHQFLDSQPDLNYRNPDVRKEMEGIMEFWLDNGIDGFRIDAVPHLFELNDITKDEPKLENLDPNLHLNETHHAYYNHIYTKDQNETYNLVQSWRNFVDEYAEKHNRDEIVLLTEAYTSLPNTIKYYSYGSHVPFNFKFITDADANSNATQLKNVIDNWTKEMPQGSVANWVMGNHDRVRVGSRYPDRADQMIMLEMILPGVAVTYYGEEIGMVDTPGPYKYDFRDGCRSPFQWDNTTSAGFSNTTNTWLPVHKNYKEVNLAKQKNESNSFYQLYTKLINLRKTDALKHGSLETKDLSKDVLAVMRANKTETVSLLINISKNKTLVDLTKLGSRVGGTSTKIEFGNKNFTQAPGTLVNNSKIELPGHAAVVLISSDASLASYSVMSLLFAVLFSLFPW